MVAIRRRWCGFAGYLEQNGKVKAHKSYTGTPGRRSELYGPQPANLFFEHALDLNKKDFYEYQRQCFEYI